VGWIAATIIGAIALVLSLRAYRRPVRLSRHRPERRAGAADPLHRQAANYRASGALPRWDP
jgi:hypothetical protein